EPFCPRLTRKRKGWHAPSLDPIFFVQPIARRDDGAHVSDGLIEWVSPEDAVENAAKMARAPGYCAPHGPSRGRGFLSGDFIRTRRCSPDLPEVNRSHTCQQLGLTRRMYPLSIQ